MPSDIGANPPPSSGQDPNYDDFIFTVLTELASEANDKFNYAMSAYEIISALQNDRPDDSGSEVIYDWPYNASESKANVSYDFEVNSTHQYIDFDFESRVREWEFQLFASVSWSIDRQGVNDDSSSSITTNSSPKRETEIERQRSSQPANVLRIPETQAQRIDISDMAERRRVRRQDKTNKSYVLRKALPLVIERYTRTGGPEVVDP